MDDDRLLRDVLVEVDSGKVDRIVLGLLHEAVLLVTARGGGHGRSPPSVDVRDTETGGVNATVPRETGSTAYPGTVSNALASTRPDAMSGEDQGTDDVAKIRSGSATIP